MGASLEAGFGNWSMRSRKLVSSGSEESSLPKATSQTETNVSAQRPEDGKKEKCDDLVQPGVHLLESRAMWLTSSAHAKACPSAALFLTRHSSIRFRMCRWRHGAATCSSVRTRHVLPTADAAVGHEKNTHIVEKTGGHGISEQTAALTKLVVGGLDDVMVGQRSLEAVWRSTSAMRTWPTRKGPPNP